MVRLIFLVLSGILFSGCALFETTGKALVDGGLDAATAWAKGMPEGAKQYIRAELHKGVEELNATGALHLRDGLRALDDRNLKAHGVAPDSFDFNADGILQDHERAKAWEQARENVQKGTGQDGQPLNIPWYWKLIAGVGGALGAGGGYFSIGKTLSRTAERRNIDKVKKIVNGGAAPPPAQT